MINEDGGVSPLLAESWTASPDLRRCAFQAAQGVRFHNGEPFNSPAVKFSFERATAARGQGRDRRVGPVDHEGVRPAGLRRGDRHGRRDDLNMPLSTRTLAAALVSCALVGCVSTYRAIEGPSAAVLSFRNESPGQMSVHIYGDSTECTNRQPLVPLVQADETRRTAVLSNQEVTFTVGQDLAVDASPAGLVRRGCLATLTFRPERGKRYLFQFRSAFGACTYQLSEAGDHAGASRPTPFVTRTWVRALAESGAFCKPRT